MAGHAAKSYGRIAMKNCIHCPNTFEPENPRQQYCTANCRRSAGQVRFRERREKGIPKVEKSAAWKRAVFSDKGRVIAAEFNVFNRDRNADFVSTLNLAQFKQLVFLPCHYCGDPPATKTKTGFLLRNGIDRMDSSLGYNFHNCVPCCWRCNRMKWQWGVEEFLAHVGKIHAHTNR